MRFLNHKERAIEKWLTRYGTNSVERVIGEYQKNMVDKMSKYW